MKKWPKDKTVSLPAGDLITPVLKVIEAGYKLERKEPIRSIPYNGYNIGSHELACCFSPKEAFSKSGLEYNEERNRSLLEVALYVAFQLGIEQGRRLNENDNRVYMAAAKRYMSELERNAKARENQSSA